MIGKITGHVLALEDKVVLIATADLGLEIQIIHPQRLSIGTKVSLYTHLHWNQEQGPSLFGFAHQSEKVLFTILLSCPGIGPKVALAILEQLSPTEFVRAVQANDSQTISSVNGIGPKKAEQLLLSVKHKIDRLLTSGAIAQSEGTIINWKELSEALGALNYSRQEISNAIAYLQNQPIDQSSFDHLLRRALSFLSKNV